MNTKIEHPERHRIEREVFPSHIEPQAQAIREDELQKEVALEIHQGLKLLRKHKLSATFYGSARHGMKEYYVAAQALAHRLSEVGFAIVTGGGDGVMGAANKGAHKAGGPSIGLNIHLPMEQRNNNFVTEEITFEYFFTRKFMLALASEVYIFFPGGFGTLDELFDVLTLMQTKKIPLIPIFLFGKEFWQPLTEFIENSLCKEYQTISHEDTGLYHIVDTVDDAYEMIIERVR